jgi:hypothetical protein
MHIKYKKSILVVVLSLSLFQLAACSSLPEKIESDPEVASSKNSPEANSPTKEPEYTQKKQEGELSPWGIIAALVGFAIGFTAF